MKIFSFYKNNVSWLEWLQKSWEALGVLTKILIFCSVIALLVTVRVIDFTPIESLRLRTFDFYQLIKPRDTWENSPVVIADIDEKSLKEIGQWPWPRLYLAEFVDALGRLEARAVGFDMVFAEKDRTDPTFIAKRHGDTLSSNTKSEIASLPDYDKEFAKSIKNFPTVMGQSGSFDLSFIENSTIIDNKECSVSGSSVFVKRLNSSDCPFHFLRIIPGLIENLKILEDNAKGKGLFSLPFDSDGIVRKVPVIQSINDSIKPSLSIELIRVAYNGRAIFARMDESGIRDVVIQGESNRVLPIDGEQSMWVYFSEPDKNNTMPRLYIPIVDIIKERISPERIKDKIVLVGTSASGLLDIRATPVSPSMPGVEVHANLIENILSDDFLSYPIWMVAVECLVIIGISIFMFAFIPKVGAWFTLFILMILLGTLVSISWYLFSFKLILLDISYPVIVSISLFTLQVFFNYVRDEGEKIKIRSAFRQYLSPELVTEIAQHPEQLRLGGDKKEMSFLFSDVRGFTSIAEKFGDNSAKLTQLINSLLTPLTKDILDHTGTIDKYMGDCIMAFWNAPLDDKHHHSNACLAALSMMQSLDILNQKIQKSYNDEDMIIRVGIGINSGTCVVGNMGSDHRFDYSVIGDPVNLASRLEGQSKTYGLTTVIGETTFENETQNLAFIEIDLITVKGKVNAVRIYTLLGNQNLSSRQDFIEFKNKHDLFLQKYRSQSWKEALKVINETKKALAICEQNCMKEREENQIKLLEKSSKTASILSQDKDMHEQNLIVDINIFDPSYIPTGMLDIYYNVMTQRIHEYQENPPDKEWDGVYIATSK